MPPLPPIPSFDQPTASVPVPPVAPMPQLPPIPQFHTAPQPSTQVAGAGQPLTMVSAQAVGPGTAAGVMHVPHSVHPPTQEEHQFDVGELIAVVGTDHVLAGDLSGFVEPVIEANRERIPDQRTEDQVRKQLTRQVLKQYVVITALAQEFFREMAGNASPDEMAKMRQEVGRRAAQVFYEKQVPALMKNYEAKDLRELEQKLREKSMSLITMKNQFIKQAIASELERKYVPDKFEVSLDELWQYYQEHASQWHVPAKARWRQLTVRFDRHESRAEVERLIKDLGNQVYLGGAPFEAVARQSSEGYTASDGGVYDWTTKGSLRSTPLDEAIFSLPLQRLSQVIEDDIGMHIIEVLERVPEHEKSFEEAQAEIRQKISEQKREEAISELHRRILSRTPVWSKWPEDLRDLCPQVRPLDAALGK